MNAVSNDVLMLVSELVFKLFIKIFLQFDKVL